MVAIMVMVGGITRLTESGLSMTKWKPVTGWFPPLSQEGWEEEFTDYKTSPEYLKINRGMSVDDFKSIFWLEYLHRLMGRITGLIFFLPLIYFAYKRYIDKRTATRLGGILCLGGFQAVVGWLMVSSGLKNHPYVSHLWLAFHLCTAFIIFALLFITALQQLYKNNNIVTYPIPGYYKKLCIFLIILTFIQVMWGGFVAGLDAGLVYNTFPDMNGKLIPDGLFVMSPAIINPFENVTTVQFTHRILAYILTFSVLAFWVCRPKQTSCGKAINILPVVILTQFTLGVFTLLHAVPVHLASAHQMGALLLFTILIYINYHLHQASEK